MWGDQDIAVESGDFIDARAESGNDVRMIAEAIIVAADGGQAVGIDDAPADAAVAADPVPAECARSVSRSRDSGQHQVA